MKKLLLLFSMLAIMATSYGQTPVYSSTLSTTAVNKPMGANGYPLDARTYFYNSTKFLFRPYVSTAEALSYLPTALNRTGQFPIIINTGGTINSSTGVLTGGTNAEWWFRDGVADVNLVLRGGPDIPTGTLGALYEKRGWTDFTDFIAQNDFALSEQNIYTPANSSTSISLPQNTALDTYNLSWEFRNVTGAAQGVPAKVGFKSTSAAAISVYFYLNENTKKLVGEPTYGPAPITSDQVLTNYTPGDIVRISVDYAQLAYTITATNLTKGSSISWYIADGLLDLTKTFLSHNTAQVTILASGGASRYTINYLSYSSKTKNGGILVIGDSITQSTLASSAANRYPIQIGAQIDAGAGNLSADIVSILPEVLKIKPVECYVMIGTNDPDIEVWKVNIKLIITTLQNAGIKVVAMSPPPSNLRSVVPFRDYLAATFPNIFFDTYNLMRGSGTDYNPAYNSGDGVHPNAAGMTALANGLKARSGYVVYPYSQVDTTTVSKLNNTGIIPGSYGGLQIRADGRVSGASSSTSGIERGILFYEAGQQKTVASVTLNDRKSFINLLGTVDPDRPGIAGFNFMDGQSQDAVSPYLKNNHDFAFQFTRRNSTTGDFTFSVPLTIGFDYVDVTGQLRENGSAVIKQNQKNQVNGYWGLDSDGSSSVIPFSKVDFGYYLYGNTNNGINIFGGPNAVSIKTNGVDGQLIVDGSGNTTIKGNTTAPNLYNIVTTKPTSTTSAGKKNDAFADSTGFYICIATNTWKKIVYDPTF